MLANINFIAVLAATVLGFAFGWLWYGVLFTKAWMDNVGWNPEQRAMVEAGGNRNPAPFIICFIGELVMAVILSGILWHIGKSSVTSGMISGAFCWLGFVLPVIAITNAYGLRPLKLTLIDAGHFLGVLLIQGAVLGWFGR